MPCRLERRSTQERSARKENAGTQEGKEKALSYACQNSHMDAICFRDHATGLWKRSFLRRTQSGHYTVSNSANYFDLRCYRRFTFRNRVTAIYPKDKHWAYATIGTILGFWLRGFSGH